VAVAAGISRLWDSADCTPTSAASHVVVLAPGRPDLQWVTWDRKTASPGCTAAARTVRLGAYTATAFGHRVQSNTLIFVLGGKGVAVP
jgi:hypothetical protein